MKSLILFKPHWLSFKNVLRRGEPTRWVRWVILFALGTAFWIGCFVVTVRILRYFHGVDGLGQILIYKFLSMILIAFFSVLLLSNLITALSTFYLSEELELLLASPQPSGRIYLYKSIETFVLSSWMVFIFALPILSAFGWVLKAPLLFYVMMMGLLVPYFMIPAALGMIMAMLIVKAFPAKRMQDIFFLLTVIVVAGLYLFFRFIQPEKLVNPDAFAELTQYLTALSTPSSMYLPTTWITEVLMFLLVPSETDVLFLGGLVLTTASALWIIGGWVAAFIYHDGWSKAQEARRVRFSKGSVFDRIIGRVIKGLPVPLRALLLKDIKIFLRTTAQWSQLLLLVALMIVYVYNFKVLPLRLSPIGSAFFENTLAFLNIGLAAFVLTAIAVRLVYPAISLEGQAIWVIQSSPLTFRRFWWGKFWISVLPLTLLAEVLVILTNYYLGVAGFMMVISVATIMGLSIGITSLGMLLGGRYPNFQATNPVQISMGFGGVVYMILAMLYVGVVIILQAGPMYVLISREMLGQDISTGLLVKVTAVLGAVFVLQAVFIVVTVRMGLRSQSLSDANT